MGKPFKNELEALPDTYRWARQLSFSNLEGLLGPAGLPLYVIGSGGSLSAAHLIADLYETTAGVPARVETPLGLARALRSLRAFKVLILSAGGSNRDILGACRQAIQSEPRHLSVVCATTGSPLAALARAYDGASVLEFDLPIGRDGFLATNSLMATAVLMTRAICGRSADQKLPSTLEGLLRSPSRGPSSRIAPDFLARETLLVLHGDQTRAAAVDLESKLTEAALSRVQVADFRNFAHGRHHWLAKRPDESAVLAFETRDDRALIERTLRLLPSTIPILRVTVQHEVPISSLAAIASTFFIVQQYGEVRGIDPGRPGVPQFGRRIYNLNAFSARSKRTSQDIENIAVRRKLNAVGIPPDAALAPIFRAAFRNQVRSMARRGFRALVLDYDGTICDRDHRYGPAPTSIARILEDRLNEGLVVGIATGRGRSVRDALRQRLPRAQWPRIFIGYYNCAEIGTLADGKVPRRSKSAGDNLEPVARALTADVSITRLCEIEPRRCQITVKPRDGVALSEVGLWSLTNECIKRAGIVDVAVLSSSHSVDVVSHTCTKLDLLSRLPDGIMPDDVLCVGDRGRWPGNDWQLLNHTWSLSVDEVSTALDRGWNIAPAGLRGSRALEFYLSRLRHRRGRFALDIRAGAR